MSAEEFTNMMFDKIDVDGDGEEGQPEDHCKSIPCIHALQLQ